jgi:two-component system response regulator PilR (NtrC family)
VDDLPILCQALLSRIAEESGVKPPVIEPEVLQHLASLPLAGNVRELENLLHRAVALGDGVKLKFEMPEHIPGVQMAASRYTETESAPGDLGFYLDDLERNILRRAMASNDMNVQVAAAQLGLSSRQLDYRLNRLGMQTFEQDHADDLSKATTFRMPL